MYESMIPTRAVVKEKWEQQKRPHIYLKRGGKGSGGTRAVSEWECARASENAFSSFGILTRGSLCILWGE